MQLIDLTTYKTIYIQCHDNPDADTLASGFALYSYFIKQLVDVHLFYSGRLKIQKSNLLYMVESLEIPITYIDTDSLQLTSELLITVDCQYGAGNVSKQKAAHYFVIDHHQPEFPMLDNMLIESSIGSCSTFVWLLLTQVGFPINSYPNIATALYYGLYMDTSQFGEISHPADKDMRDSLLFDKNIFKYLRNSNLTSAELALAGFSMIRTIYDEENRCSLTKAQQCDPNILGLISDLCLQVDSVDACVVFNEPDDGIKFSVRSCTKEVEANDFASYLADGIGSGGGHIEKAGGFIHKNHYEDSFPNTKAEAYFSSRIKDYYNCFDIIYAEKFSCDITLMKKYKKLNLPVGFLFPKDFFPIDTPVTIRSLGGDLETIITDDLVLLVDSQGFVALKSLAYFENNYEVTTTPFITFASYTPTIKNRVDEKKCTLSSSLYTCIPLFETKIYARPLVKAVKVFTKWDQDNYMLGEIGDYLAVSSSDFQDLFVITKDAMDKRYIEWP